jgi:hypothetical protein
MVENIGILGAPPWLTSGTTADPGGLTRALIDGEIDIDGYELVIIPRGDLR